MNVFLVVRSWDNVFDTVISVHETWASARDELLGVSWDKQGFKGFHVELKEVYVYGKDVDTSMFAVKGSNGYKRGGLLR